MECEFELPWPPSVNHYYRHVGPRVLISRDGRDYREKVVAKLAAMKLKTFGGAVELHAEFYPPDKRRRDLDNLLKCALDTLQIARINAVRHEPMPPDGMAYIRIRDYAVSE